MTLLDQITDFITSPALLLSIAIIAGAAVLLMVLRRVFKTAVAYFIPENSVGSRRDRIVNTVYTLVKYFVMFLALMLVLQANGVSITSIVASMGLVSVVLGFALQDTLNDVIMWFHIVSDHFFEVGDVIKIDGMEGRVDSITPQTTKITLTADGSQLNICNRQINRVIVCSRLVDIDMPLPYSVPAARVDEVMDTICKKIAQIEGVESCQFMGTQTFADSAILYKIRFFCEPFDKFGHRRKANRIIQDELALANIEIPFNQLDVHINQ